MHRGDDPTYIFHAYTSDGGSWRPNIVGGNAKMSNATSSKIYLFLSKYQITTTTPIQSFEGPSFNASN